MLTGLFIRVCTYWFGILSNRANAGVIAGTVHIAGSAQMAVCSGYHSYAWFILCQCFAILPAHGLAAGLVTLVPDIYRSVPSGVSSIL